MDRRSHRRRKHDFYKELGKLAGLIGCTAAAVLGQAELIGEPLRHYVTVTAIMCTAIWAYCMRPSSIREAVAFLRRK